MLRRLIFVMTGLALVAVEAPALAKPVYCRIRVETAPKDATLRLGRRSYTTPKDLWLRLGATYNFRIEKTGYQPRKVTIRPAKRYETHRYVLVRPMGTLVLTAADAKIAGAAVSIDGKAYAPVPTTIELAPGSRVLEVTKPGFQPLRQPMTIEVGKTLTIDVKLDPALGQLFVATDPTGAEISVDQKVAGQSPLLLDKLTVGKHVVELRLGKNPPVSRIVDIEAGKTSRLQVKLVAPKVAAVAGALQLLSDPTPVDAYVDGAFAGKTPLKLDKLALGSHVVALKWPGYKTAERTVTIEPKRLVTLKLKLESATTASGPSSAPTGGLGNLIVVASIRGATVYLNGARVGKTPFARAKLTAGMHEVRVVASGYEPMDDQVQVTAGRTARVTAILQPLPAGGGAVAGGGVAGGPGGSAPADGGSGGTAALSAFGAQLVPPRAFTADLSLGFPHLVSLRLVTGVFDRKHLGLDVGVTVRSYGTVTEGSITGRVRLLRYDPFALAVFGELGAGGGPLDRDTFFFKVGVLGTLLFKDIISVTASVYGDFYSERICPTSEQTDEPEACTFPPEDLSFDEVRGRFTAARIFLAATIEASLSPTINLFAQIEGAPFQAQRRSYTDAFASYMLDTDPRFYGRVGVAFKF